MGPRAGPWRGRIRERSPRSGRGGVGLSAVVAAAALAACAGTPGTEIGPTPAATVAPEAAPSPTYRAYVANESSDLVSRVAFRSDTGAWVENEVPVGLMPSDNDGAHGITVSPDGRYWYLTLAHGTPYGQLWKFHAGPDTLLSRADLGLFPATMSTSTDGALLIAANFNLHGDMVPSDVSVVHTPTMVELTRVETCLMPHGSRVSVDGAKHYSACMHSDQLVEIDMATLSVSGRFRMTPGHERAIDPDRGGSEMATALASETGAGSVCSPTWVEPSEVDPALLYVACNKNGEVLEVDADAWRVRRRFPTGNAPYNLEATADGRVLLATLKAEQAVAVFDLESGLELARIPTSRPVTHGVVASPDSRFAFVSNESIGAVLGTVDVIDIAALARVASVEVGQQAGGIGYWDPPAGGGGSP